MVGTICRAIANAARIKFVIAMIPRIFPAEILFLVGGV
jgi:hypothetical protein